MLEQLVSQFGQLNYLCSDADHLGTFSTQGETGSIELEIG